MTPYFTQARAEPATHPTLRAVHPGLVLLLPALILALFLPGGFVGGDSDDYHYLLAAECWANSGGWLSTDACLPRDHWQARWPMIGPMSVVIALSGTSRFTVSIVPFLYSCAVLLLFSDLVNRIFGRGAALLGGLLLLFTPAFTRGLLTANVDSVELTFVLAFAAAGWRALEARSAWWAAAAGFALALAVQTRETSLALTAVAGFAILLAPAARRLALFAAAGFALPLSLELMLFALRTGDPFRRVSLALNHTRIPSTELPDPAASAVGAPLFNPAVIGGWRPSSGLDLHWTVNGPVNLLIHPYMGLTLIAACVLVVAYRREPFVNAEVRKRSSVLAAAAAGVALLLIYGLAIDPKPRMFLMPLAAAAAIAGAFGAAAWQARRRALVLFFGALIPGRAVLVLLSGMDVAAAEQAAGSWLRRHPEAISMSGTTARHLALVPESRGVPTDDDSRPLRMEIGWGTCRDRAAAAAAREGARLEPLASYGLRPREPAFLQRMRRSNMAAEDDYDFTLCVFGQR
jgi:4-amino-4-deoxy-L-arabinose transferase-like glycosyltransferase